MENRKTPEEVMEEVKLVLAKYDMAGLVFIHSAYIVSPDEEGAEGIGSHSTWHMKIMDNEISYSCMSLKDELLELNTNKTGYSEDDKVLRLYGTLNLAAHAVRFSGRALDLFNTVFENLNKVTNKDEDAGKD